MAAHDHETPEWFAAGSTTAAASVGRRLFLSILVRQRAPQPAGASGSQSLLLLQLQVLLIDKLAHRQAEGNGSHDYFKPGLGIPQPPE